MSQRHWRCLRWIALTTSRLLRPACRIRSGGALREERPDLLLKAVLEGQREDLAAKKHTNLLGILTSLQIAYQPGALLKNLEETA